MEGRQHRSAEQPAAVVQVVVVQAHLAENVVTISNRFAEGFYLRTVI
jgi:hypothetical protein